MIHVYVSCKDQGFAPNVARAPGQTKNVPQCTFATCCPSIRKTAQINDIVVGTTSVERNAGVGTRRILWMGRVREITTFEAFYVDPRFQHKKADGRNSIGYQRFGDNIYRRNAQGMYEQDPATTKHNKPTLIKRDLSCDRVLIMDLFSYYGAAAVAFPPALAPLRDGLRLKQRRHVSFADKHLYDSTTQFLIAHRGVHGQPMLWKKEYGPFHVETHNVC